MPAAIPIAMLAVTAASTAFAGYQASKGPPDMGPAPTPPPDAVASEATAQNTGDKAKRKMLTAIGDSAGRGSTILTGGGLGDLGSGQAKTLLGS